MRNKFYFNFCHRRDLKSLPDIYFNTMKVTVKAADTPPVLDDNNIQFALKNAMLVAQFFGFFPLHGVTSSSPGSLKFSWISIKTIYACFTFLMTVFSAVCQLYRMVTVEINILQMSNFFRLYTLLQ